MRSANTLECKTAMERSLSLPLAKPGPLRSSTAGILAILRTDLALPFALDRV